MSDILDDLDSLLTGAQIEAAGRKKVVATRRDWDENYRASFRVYHPPSPSPGGW